MSALREDIYILTPALHSISCNLLFYMMGKKCIEKGGVPTSTAFSLKCGYSISTLKLNKWYFF